MSRPARHLVNKTKASRKSKRKTYKFRVKISGESAFDKIQRERRAKMLGLKPKIKKNPKVKKPKIKKNPKIKKKTTLTDAMKNLSLHKKQKPIPKFDLGAAFASMSVKTPKISQKQKQWLEAVKKRIDTKGLTANVSALKTNVYGNVGDFELEHKHLPHLKNKNLLRMKNHVLIGRKINRA